MLAVVVGVLLLVRGIESAVSTGILPLLYSVLVAVNIYRCNYTCRLCGYDYF